MSKIITESDLVTLIRDNVSGTSFVSIDISTDPRMRKTGNPYAGKVRKLNTITGCIGFDYETGVNRLAAKEGKDEREAKSRKWGTLTADRLFVEHKGAFYLQMKVESSDTPRFILSETGETVERDTIAQWLPEKRKSSTQSDLEGEVVVRDVKVENIKSIRFKGQSYTVVGKGQPVEYEVETLSVTESQPVEDNVPAPVN